MKKTVFEKVVDNIYILKIPFAGIYTTAVLVKSCCGISLIDSGACANDVDKVIVPALAELDIDVCDIDNLLCTHTHGDHIGGHARLQELGVKNVAVYCRGVSKITDPLKYNRLIRQTFPEFSAPVSNSLRGCVVNSILDDNATVGGLTLVATSGHDDDCVCFYEPVSKTLISGDSIQVNGSTTLGCALYMDGAAYHESLLRLREFEPKRVILGHEFRPFSDAVVGGSKAVEMSLELFKKYDILIKEQDSKLTFDERAVDLIKKLAGEVPEYLFLGMYTVREHLRRLGIYGQ